MVLELAHAAQDPLRLLGVLRLVGVAEVARRVEPVADGHVEAVLLRLVELLLRVVRGPGAERVGAELGEDLLRAAAAGALDDERLAVHGEALRAGRALDADDGRRGGRAGSRDRDRRKDE